MDLETELRLRLQIVQLEAERLRLLETLARLIRYTSVPATATSRSYSSKEMIEIKVLRRHLVSAHRLLEKYSE